MTKKKPELPPLTERQLEIMEVVWESGEASVFEVREALSEHRDVARTTVRTLMERLEASGWLTHRVVGRTCFYTASVPREATVGQKVLDVVDRVCGGSPEQLMSALLEYRGLKKDEIDRIEAMLEEARKQRTKKGDR